MLGWLEFLGKLFEFVTTKFVGAHLDLKLDQKARACRGLLRFYDLVLELEGLAAAGATTLEPIIRGQKTRLYPPALKQLARRSDTLSEHFLVELTQLIRALEILEPALAKLLSSVAVGKRSLISRNPPSAIFDRIASKCTVSTKEGIGTCLGFDTPSPQSLTAFETAYSSIPLNALIQMQAERRKFLHLVEEELFTTEQEQLFWDPGDPDLLNSIVPRHQVHALVLEPEDYPLIRSLHDAFKAHGVLLHTTRTAVRAFIAERFSLEDLLYAANP
jgi:hypothetical protein